MKYSIQFSPLARRQINDAFEYIQSQHAPLNASDWLEGIIQAITSLNTFPQAHGFARENDQFKEELRQLVFKSHRIVFDIDIQNKRVRIHQVVHVARLKMDADDPGSLKKRS